MEKHHPHRRHLWGRYPQVVETNDWQSMKSMLDVKKCNQCLLCTPVCPDTPIPANKGGKRKDFNYSFCKGCSICASVCPITPSTEIPQYFSAYVDNGEGNAVRRD